MKTLRLPSALLRTGTLALACMAMPILADTPTDMSRTFDQYSWVTTHNAFTSNGVIPNQSQTIDRQLAEGIRSLMLDLHPDEGRVRLCHSTCTGTPQPFADLINHTLLPFLERDPNAVVSLHLEDFTDAGQLIAELDRAPGLAGKTFNPEAWSTPAWPTYADIVASGQRILIFSLNSDHSGALMTRAGAVHIMPSDVFTVENYWSLGASIFDHDYRCRSRWSEATQPLDQREIDGKPGWRPLFTMNQFHTVPLPLLFPQHAAKDNAFGKLQTRYLTHCRPVAKRKPNFVAVDFHQYGDTAKFADWLTWWAVDELR